MERFKSECKAKGFTQPVDQPDWGEGYDEGSGVKRKRRQAATIRLVRSNEIFLNKSEVHIVEESEKCFDDFCDGWSDKPVPVANDSFEAVCGNLTLT
jgi:hypothetical protein